jgi:hypothetical protein
MQTRQQLVEERFEAVLVRKHSPASARNAHLRRSRRGQTDRAGLLRYLHLIFALLTDDICQDILESPPSGPR